MYYLVYSSLTKTDLEKEELFKILEDSRIKNDSKSISGILICVNEGIHPEILDGIFLQVLEGEKENVLELYDNIKNDQRHHSVNIIAEGVHLERMFDEWKMGYRDLNILEFKAVLRQFDLSQDDILKPNDIDEKSDTILELMKSFYRNPKNL